MISWFEMRIKKIINFARLIDLTIVLRKKLVFRNLQSKKGCKDRKSIQSSTTPDPGYQLERDKLTIRDHKQVPRGQPFPSR